MVFWLFGPKHRATKKSIDQIKLNYKRKELKPKTHGLKHNVLCFKTLSQLIEIEFFGGVYVGDKRLLNKNQNKQNKTSSTQEAIVK